MFIKLFSLLLLTTSSPQYILSIFTSGISLGSNPSTASAIAFIWAAVVPQHPPTILTFLSSANCLTKPAVISGNSSYSPKILGNPALG